jgi:hypothetical protein
MTTPQKLTPISILTMMVVGILLAVFISVLTLISHTKNQSLINPNGWRTIAGIGSSDADFITRAVVAKIGLYANSKEKAIYMGGIINAELDYKKLLSGPKHWFSLDSNAHYQITGNVNLPASWWSVTLSNDQELLVDSETDQYSFSNFSLVTDDVGNYVIDIAKTKPDGTLNWLPTPQQGIFNIKLRIYQPSPELYNNIATYDLPKLSTVMNSQQNTQVSK